MRRKVLLDYITFFIKILERLKNKYKKDQFPHGRGNILLIFWHLQLLELQHWLFRLFCFFQTIWGLRMMEPQMSLCGPPGFIICRKSRMRYMPIISIEHIQKFASGTERPGNIRNSQLVFIEAAKFLNDVITKR